MGEILFLIILGILSFIYNNFIVKDRGQAEDERDLSDWLPTPEPKPSPEATPQVQSPTPPPIPVTANHHAEVKNEAEFSTYQEAYNIKDKATKKVRVSKHDFQKRNKLKKALIMNTVLAKPKALERP